ncbi:hypothetical protein F7725_025329 [Dissostichus mawsoni]|uniref:Borealin n=1 Tax=Dissostichus mawsoni TaxID=36200 RepID=A0A7J5XAU5_DISMA|nr:hypothetical protein F7725_025329 [Dissostichus mawsoni]
MSDMAPRKTRTTAKARKNSTKTVKLQAFLEDFDSEVKTRVEQMKEKLNHLLKDLDNGYNMILIKLPKTIRQMPWMEQFKSEEPKSPEVANVTTKKSTKSTSEDGNTSGTTRKAKATRKPPTTSKRAKALTTSKTPAVRNPHHKERVYSISVNGSPIAAGNNEDIVINVPIGNGEMDSVDLSLLDETALRSIRQLKNRLTVLCGTE